ncbi:MAG: hypothetical protein JW822_13595 [Spirochaetales bacterium]|nr:hypothetical protein [Spirochaetales bacterium]
MKIILGSICIISLGLLAFIACVHVGEPLLTENEYNRLKQAAGDDWSISASENKLVLKSTELFWFYNAVSLPHMTDEELIRYIRQNGRKDYYEIILLFVPKWDDKKVAEAREHNNRIWKQIGNLPQKHGLTHLTRNKQNSFFPETKEDEVKIKKYEAEYAELEAMLILIPEFYSEDYSIYWQDNRLGFEAVWGENLDVQNIRALFSRH